MADSIQRRSNSALWLGLLFIVLSILSYFLYGSKLPQSVLPWINLLLPAIALVLLLIGLKRAFGQSQVYGGKVWGSIIAVIGVLFFALSVWGHIHSREVPASTGAPQVGQKVPDFTLQDSHGQPVSLAQLFSSPEGSSAKPKAVLLIFYRGYW